MILPASINQYSPASPSPLNRGLLGWWLVLQNSFGSSTRLVDILGRRHATATGWGASNWAPSTRGAWGSIRLAGSSGVYATTSGLASTNKEFTFALWLRPNTGTADYCSVATNAAGSYAGFYYRGSGGASNLYMDDFASFAHHLNTTPLTDKSWNHYASVHDSSGNMQFYLNGIPDGSSAAAQGEVLADVRFGYDYQTLGAFNGDLDDIRVWNRGLTASEVWEVYRSSRTGYSGGELNRIARPLVVNAAATGNRRRRVICAS